MRPHRRPSDLAHRGVRTTDTLWVDDRARLLALWEPGAEAREVAGGWLLRLRRARSVDTRHAPATVLAETGGRWTSAPLAPVDLARAPEGAVLLLRSGELIVAAPATLPLADPSAWMDVSGLDVLDVAPLGPPPPPPRLAVAPIEAKFAARASARLVPAPVTGPSLGAGLRRSMAGAIGGLTGALRSVAPSSSWLDTLDRWSQRLGLGAALEAAVGQHNARYLQEMLDLFEQGRWEDAVERGIPLGGEGSGVDRLTWLKALGGIRFRAAGAGGGSVGMDASVYDHLKRLYRRAFEELDRAGRVKEAAYVLSDLLYEVGEAVTYLEGKGAHGAAAELAEARSLDAGLVVLLWLRAGDLDRALAIAAARNAWAAALQGLEARGLRDEAERVRAAWARREASAGRAVAALELAWPLPSLREEAVGWLDDAIAAGGVGGARALAKSLAVRHDRIEADLERATALAFDPAPDAPPARRALAAALGATAPELRALRAVARGLLLDAAPRGGGPVGRLVRQAAERAAARCGDGALSADLPALGVAPEPSWPDEAVTQVARASETGTTAVHDVARLPRGRLLVALGDQGAAVYGLDGRRISSVGAPAHALVPSPDGSRVLLVGRRADRQRLSRLEDGRRLVPWCDAALDRWCDGFDGGVWFASHGGRVVALDATAAGLRALWSVPLVADTMSATPGHLRLVASGEGFLYELPSLTLRQRWPLPEDARPLASSDRGVLLDRSGRLEHAVNGGTTSTLALDALAAASRGPWDLAIGADRVWLLQPDGLELRIRASLVLEGATRCGARLLPDPEGEGSDWLLVWDDRGRVRALDLACGALVADLRI